MHIAVSDTPAENAGNHISEILQKRSQVLLLLSGGSSLEVLNAIDEFALGTHITVIMADERFCNNESGNNFLNLKNTSFYDVALKQGVAFIETVPNTKDATPEDFAIAINKTLSYFMKLNAGAYVTALLGVGEDGHFASVFPKDARELFYAQFHTNDLYIAVHEEGVTYPDRTTITPYFLKNHVNEVVLFAKGETKCKRILSELRNEQCKEYDVPAVIPARHPNSFLFTDCIALS